MNEWVKKGFVKKWDKDKKNLWNSPLLAVPKKSGGRVDPDDIRVCLDLRAVNALTKDPSNILPSPAELFECVWGCKIFYRNRSHGGLSSYCGVRKESAIVGFSGT